MIARLLLLACLVAGVGYFWKRHAAGPDVAGAEPVLSVVSLVNGEAVRENLDVRAKPLLALYHGASWCPPCQAFSPVLAEFYRRADHEKFTLLMVNYDRAERDMVGYMKQHHMGFPAVEMGNAGGWGRSTGSGIPNLIIIDLAQGKVVDSSYDGDRYKGPMEPLQTLKRLLAQ